MTADEVIDLLTLMASFDRRTVGKADVAAWKLAIGDLPFADAQEAVVLHYAESRDWVMPADVRRRVKTLRADRIARIPPPPPPPGLADKPRQYAEALRLNVRSIADGRSVQRALGGAPRGGEPPPEWTAARKAIELPGPERPDPLEVAREQVAESRRERGEGGS